MRIVLPPKTLEPESNYHSPAIYPGINATASLCMYYPTMLMLNILTYPSWPHKCSWKTVRNKTDTATIRTKVIDCGFPKCSATFKYVKAFDRHYRTVHIRAAKNLKLDCTVEGCHRVGEEGFTRKDNLTQHLRSVHGEVIPKNPMRFNGLSGLSGWNEPIVVRGQQANIED